MGYVLREKTCGWITSPLGVEPAKMKRVIRKKQWKSRDKVLVMIRLTREEL